MFRHIERQRKACVEAVLTTIAICLATRNGGRFLSEQLASIAAQSYRNWHLHARDDGSTDATPDILADFARDHPDRVTLIEDDLGRLGAKGNFNRLMGLVREPYIAFADQDDIWHPDKLARAMVEMRRIEAGHGASTPVMVHADRRVVDAAGREIAPSYWLSRRIAPGTMRPAQHLAFCVAAGSTMLINRPLLDRVHPVPEAARMHDTWIELVAQYFGVVSRLEAPALDFRRHGGNASGARTDGDSAEARRLGARAARLWDNPERQRRIWKGYFAQAEAFRRRFGDVLAPAEVRRLRLFLSLPGQRRATRLLTLLRSGAAPPGVLRGLVLVALCGPEKPNQPAGTPPTTRAASA